MILLRMSDSPYVDLNATPVGMIYGRTSGGLADPVRPAKDQNTCRMIARPGYNDLPVHPVEMSAPWASGGSHSFPSLSPIAQ